MIIGVRLRINSESVVFLHDTIFKHYKFNWRTKVNWAICCLPTQNEQNLLYPTSCCHQVFPKCGTEHYGCYTEYNFQTFIKIAGYILALFWGEKNEERLSSVVLAHLPNWVSTAKQQLLSVLFSLGTRNNNTVLCYSSRKVCKRPETTLKTLHFFFTLILTVWNPGRTHV